MHTVNIFPRSEIKFKKYPCLFFAIIHSINQSLYKANRHTNAFYALRKIHNECIYLTNNVLSSENRANTSFSWILMLDKRAHFTGTNGSWPCFCRWHFCQTTNPAFNVIVTTPKTTPRVLWNRSIPNNDCQRFSAPKKMCSNGHRKFCLCFVSCYWVLS